MITVIEMTSEKNATGTPSVNKLKTDRTFNSRRNVQEFNHRWGMKEHGMYKVISVVEMPSGRKATGTQPLHRFKMDGTC